MSVPMPIVLDYSSFPHIFESVLANVADDYSTILTCRQLSTHIRDLIDPKLFTHIALCRPGPTGIGLEARQASAPFNRLPLITTEAKSTTAIESFNRQLAHTNYIDYFGTRVNLDPFASALTNLKVLRRPKALDSPLVAPTFVDYRDLTSPSGIALCGGPIVSVGVRPGCKRLVMHLTYDAGNTSLNDIINKFAIHEGVMEMEFVYSPKEGTTPVPGLPVVFGELLGLIGGKLIWTIGPALARKAKVVIVGVEKMQAAWLNIDGDPRGQDLVDRVADFWEEQLRRELQSEEYEGVPWNEEDIKAALPVFKTLEEWTATAPPLERLRPEYDAPFCTDESLLIPGGRSGQYYEEWKGREAYEEDPELFWHYGRLDHEAIRSLDSEEENLGPEDEFDSDGYYWRDDDEDYDEGEYDFDQDTVDRITESMLQAGFFN